MAQISPLKSVGINAFLHMPLGAICSLRNAEKVQDMPSQLKLILTFTQECGEERYMSFIEQPTSRGATTFQV